MRFEERLASVVAGLALIGAGGCADEGPSEPLEPPRQVLEAMCYGGDAPEDYYLLWGFVTVDPGAPCPSVEEAEPRRTDWFFWAGVTCTFEQVDTNQVSDGVECYGGFTDAGNNPSAGPPVDVCVYSAVFNQPPQSGVCGRPLLDGGAPLVAPVAAGPGWCHAAAPRADALDPDARAAAARYWLDCARLEHASVASFARFALDLMRLGAPPELLAAAHAAAADEIAHARLCFALASGYAGRPLGPGPLAVPADTAPELAAIAEAVVREGCVGETLAAVDAAARLAEATDPAVRAALERIVGDESDHAALAWRTLRWLLTRDADGSLAARLDRVFAEERARWTAPASGGDPPASARAHGLISAAARARALRRAWDAVIAPTWAGRAA